ncbi:MAG: hypothetical protein U1E82_03860 [Nitrosomonas sp.]|nr:hypothetical protein [Nitrosomonas sp.]
MENKPINRQSISTEADVDRLITLYKKACTENTQLKKQLAAVLQKHSQLTDKIETAAYRLEKLLSDLPIDKKQD